MDAVRAHLVRREAQLVLLLTPPFDRHPHDPGYIKGYLPGIRENGGQYTHAALWTVIALARQGRGDDAMELFHMINPINHARTPEDRRTIPGESPMSSRQTCTRTRCTWAGRVGVVHGLGRMDVPRRRRQPARAAAAWSHVQHGPVRPGDVAGMFARLEARPEPVPHPGGEPRPPGPRRSIGDARR